MASKASTKSGAPAANAPKKVKRKAPKESGKSEGTAKLKDPKELIWGRTVRPKIVRPQYDTDNRNPVSCSNLSGFFVVDEKGKQETGVVTNKCE